MNSCLVFGFFIFFFNSFSSSFLLESISGGERVSRFSFLGFGKTKIFNTRNYSYYGDGVKKIIEKIREEKKFNNIKQLKEQIISDIDSAFNIIN